MARQNLLDRFLRCSVSIGNLVKQLPDDLFAKNIARQLVRSGTSPYANYKEACAAESRRDFIHKLSICSKELRESRAWIRLIQEAEITPRLELVEVLGECEQLCRIVDKSISTARANRQRPFKPIRHF